MKELRHHHQQQQTKTEEDKFKSATEGMQQCCYDRLVQLSLRNKKNGDFIADYLVAYRYETATEDSTRATNCMYLIRFAEEVCGPDKSLKDVTSQDIQQYFNGVKKSEIDDPKHKWKGTWNLLRVYLSRFFKWLYYPSKEPSKRPKPSIMPYIPKMKRKEKTYRPEDMWTIEESELFFKYCPDSRIVCYHSIANATGARPQEILDLTIGDIIWPSDGTAPYFTVKGKTGQRTLKIYRFENYIKDFIERHPKKAILTSPLIWSKKRGGIKKSALGRGPLLVIYKEMKDYFSKLVDDAIGQDDRNVILRLLKKPWNPYVFRHSVTTEYLGRGALTKHQGDQFFGWSQRGNTAVHYQNYFGDEAADSLGAYFGVAQRQPPKVPKERQCSNVNCQELNTPEAPFCKKCRIPLSVAGHLEREQELAEMREQMNKITNIVYKLLGEFKRGKGLADDEIPRLTEHEYRLLDHIFTSS